MEKLSPLMQQYYSMKAKYPDAMLLFRVGDFYETFSSDAEQASKILDITLTRKASGEGTFVQMAGFPFHALDSYLPRLVRSGLRVAICEQMEDPKTTKTLVKRDIIEVVTPSLSYNDKTSDHKENNFLCALHTGKDQMGVAFLDISTGEFYVSEGKREEEEKLIYNLAPKELIVQKQKLREFQSVFNTGFLTNTFDDWVFTSDFANEIILKHFGIASLKGFGIETMALATIAAGACLHYLKETCHTEIANIQNISRLDNSKYVWLDRFTISNLELLSPLAQGGSCLFNVLNHTQTNMGSRRLSRWIVLPLIDINEIEKRQAVVSHFTLCDSNSQSIRKSLRNIGDLERMASKIACNRIAPNEMFALVDILKEIERIKFACMGVQELKNIERLNLCGELKTKIEQTISPQAPNQLQKGGVIASGVSSELDNLRELSTNGKNFLDSMQQREATRTGISSLKIGFNNVYGYYLEVTNVHKDKVPAEWVRKQTLTNAERYITSELKDYEDKILSAQDKISSIETTIYNQILDYAHSFIAKIQSNAVILSELDCLLSFAFVAEQNNYTCPKVNDSYSIRIVDGRHPVIEQMLPPSESYIANDMYLDNSSQQIGIITGPNMSGKSAYLRQNALIILMAQIGSFVPAKSADIGFVDKIFTRVGATDNISTGESTFMVEMNETASILNNISSRSFILLDEIGRGTSTYDGVSIAWSIAAYLHDNPSQRAKCLFATHYHELIAMEKDYSRIKNFHITIKEVCKKIIFLRKIAKGGSWRSFGIEVARLAGMPQKVLSQAQEILEKLEKRNAQDKYTDPIKLKEKEQNPYQLSFIQLDDPILLEIKEDILNTDIDNLTPLEALKKLNSIKKLIEKV